MVFDLFQLILQVVVWFIVNQLILPAMIISLIYYIPLLLSIEPGKTRVV